MSQSITEPLILDMVAWVAKQPRPYGEVVEPWRTNCLRLTVWEDAVERGLVACVWREAELVVAATERGRGRGATAGRLAGLCAHRNQPDVAIG